MRLDARGRRLLAGAQNGQVAGLLAGQQLGGQAADRGGADGGDLGRNRGQVAKEIAAGAVGEWKDRHEGDAIAGLLVLRERQPFTIYAPRPLLDVLADNDTMLAMCREFGFTLRPAPAGEDVVRVSLALRA